MKINIAIIGLGRVGSILLEQMLNNKERGINILAVAELSETPGKLLARSKNLPLKSALEIADMGKNMDIIFELTGSYDVRRELRQRLLANKNFHTVVAPENLAVLICLLLTTKDLPDVHKHKGY